MNLQENISRIKQVMGLLVEEEQNKYKGNKRIILIGPPTVGKSFVADTLSKELGIEYIKLDKLQQKFGYGEGKEFELVNHVLSPDFKKYNTSSILDFGGGHVYNKGIDKLLKDYPNVFLLMPSKNYDKSIELIKKGNVERWSGFMNQIIDGLKSGKHNHTKEKEQKLIDTLEKMKKGEGGQVKKEDLPDTPEMKGWEGVEMEKDWDKQAPLTPEENKINQSVGKHLIPVYNEDGNRKSVNDIVKDIEEKLS